jgi:hypothetical protein
MKFAAIAGLALVAAAPAAASEAKSNRAADEAALTQIKTQTWPGFYLGQDADGLGAFLDPGFVNIGPDGSVSTRADELTGVRSSPWNPTNFRYEVERFVWLKDDLVIVIGKGMSERQNDNGEACEHSYTSSNLLERTPGTANGWRALSSHVSGLRCDPL